MTAKENTANLTFNMEILMHSLALAALLSILLYSSSIEAAKIGFLVVATGKYSQFIPPLIKSARKHFCQGHEVTYFIFTDGAIPPEKDQVVLHHTKMGWPFDTMLRYQAYVAHWDQLSSQDYLFACDADMLFVDNVGDEILGELVATMHPGFYNGSPFPRIRGSYDTNPLSTACVRNHEGAYYFAGGFYGGRASAVLEMAETNLKHIYQDLAHGVIALWHDESHWNRYCIDHPPTVILSPSYCYPENWNLPCSRKLLALDKDHAAIR